jgi:hypothetical protein
MVRRCACGASQLLVCVDGWASSPHAILRAFSEQVKEGIQASREQIQIWPQLIIGQVIKTQKKSRLVSVKHTLLRGDEQGLEQCLEQSWRGDSGAQFRLAPAQRASRNGSPTKAGTTGRSGLCTHYVSERTALAAHQAGRRTHPRREKSDLTRLLESSQEVKHVHQLLQAFLQMLRERRPEHLNGWMKEVRASGIKELNSFVIGIERDYDAVRAGLTFHWSQGPVEGTVNKIKTHKRLMYGRASFTLLRQKLLHLT